MTNPRVTAIVCNHNYGKWIVDALEAIQNQTYPCTACVVIDDGSDDNSVEVVKNFIEKSPQNPTQFSLLNLPTSHGPSYARNVGIKSAWEFSDCFLIVDADDIPYNNKTEKLAGAMMKDFDNIGLCYSDYDTLNVENGNRIRVYKEPYSRERLFQECITHSGALLNKKILAQSGLYDEEMRTCEDWDVFLRMSKFSTFRHIPESLTLVRVHQTNSTGSVSKEVWNKNWSIIQKRMVDGLYN